jgi:integrase
LRIGVRVVEFFNMAAMPDPRVKRVAKFSGLVSTGGSWFISARERVAAAGYDPTGFSGHSLRSGFATSAAAAGVSSWRIRQQTGHASDAMLARYIRDGELFIDDAAGALL